MKFDPLHPLNAAFVKHKAKSNAPMLRAPESHPDPYLKRGSHPEIVARVWDDLGAAIPAGCRAIVYGSPVLADPHCGVVFAMAYGTAYALRVPINKIETAYRKGCQAQRAWTTGGTTNIAKILGSGWVFGAWHADELKWVGEVYKELQALKTNSGNYS